MQEVLLKKEGEGEEALEKIKQKLAHADKLRQQKLEELLEKLRLQGK